MQADLARLARIGEAVHAIQVLSPQEIRIEGQGRVRLQDIESGEQVSVDLSLESIEQVKERLQSFRRRLASHCRRHHIGFTYCDASDGWRAVLMRHMQQLGGAGV